MAPGLPNSTSAPPKKKKPTLEAPSISITEGDGGGDQSVSFSFSFTCDDNDNDQPQDPGNERSTRPTSSHLHPHSHSRQNSLLRPPGQEVTYNNMSSEDGGIANGNPGDTSTGSPPKKNPFNFQTQFMDAAPVKSNIGQRRGHRYKHSSISASHSFFQEPPPRPPPVLPASLPIPTLKEAWSSMQRDQRTRLLWSCAHAAVAVYVFFSAENSLAMTALSHLVFFDVGSAAVCVAVDVLGNFEVWRRSSIRHPFGLQRAEVLAGFAMSIFLVFGGFDLISHNLKHTLETVGDHAPHHSHANPREVSPGTIDLASLAAAASTLMSAYGLRNHTRIRRVMRVPLPYLSSILPGAGILANPFHFLTLCFSFLMLLLPLVSVPYFVWLDRVICAAIAGCMFILGTRLAVAQGLMLLMSYNEQPIVVKSTTDKKDDGMSMAANSSVSAVLREIEAEPQVARVEEAQFWQVHYGLAMANLKVCLVKGLNTSTGSSGGGMFGHDDNTIAQLRSRLARVVQNRLGGEGYGRGGSLRWEVTVQMSTDGK
ncbi:Cation efflux family domain containing protein [Naviculisporaceae sp. PSN 640]